MEALKMERQMDNWNDDRLDELSQATQEGFAEVKAETKEGFEKVDKRFERVEGEMKEGFAKVDRRFERVEGEMKAGFERLDDKFDRKFDRLQYTLLVAVFAILATLIGPALT